MNNAKRANLYKADIFQFESYPTNSKPILNLLCWLINRPGVAWAVLQTPPLLINWLTDWWFFEISSKLCVSQTVKARKLKFWGNVHYPLCVMCHMSCVTCHVSHVTCHMSHVKCHVSHVNLVELVGGGSVINGAYPV